jgi:hypothetical protein
MNLKNTIAIILLTQLAWGCHKSERPFVIAQVCLQSIEDKEDFIALLREAAQSEGMTFKNSSAKTVTELDAISKITPHYTVSSKIINIGLIGSDGFGATASNIGMPDNQIAVGFSKGKRPKQARLFSRTLVARIEKRWKVELISGEYGARGMSDCEISQHVSPP